MFNKNNILIRQNALFSEPNSSETSYITFANVWKWTDNVLSFRCDSNNKVYLLQR